MAKRGKAEEVAPLPVQPGYIGPARMVKDIGFEHLKLIILSAERDEANIEITSRRLEEFDPVRHGHQWKEIAGPLWKPALAVFSALTGWAASQVIPARWRMGEYGDSIHRHFNAPTWADPPWRGWQVMIHLRGGFISARDVDYDLLDFFFIPSPVWYDVNDGSCDDNEEVLAALMAQLPVIESAMTEIARVITGDDVVVKAQEAIWEKQCVPEWGANGYWIKCVVT